MTLLDVICGPVRLPPVRSGAPKIRISILEDLLNTPSSFCNCGTGTESTGHFLLKCPFFTAPRKKLFEAVDSLTEGKLPHLNTLDNFSLTEILLYGHESLNPNQNKGVLNATIDYIQNTERFA